MAQISTSMAQTTETSLVKIRHNWDQLTVVSCDHVNKHLELKKAKDPIKFKIQNSKAQIQHKCLVPVWFKSDLHFVC